MRRLFQAAVEIIKKKLPKATDIDFHGCGSYAEIGITAVFRFKEVGTNTNVDMTGVTFVAEFSDGSKTVLHHFESKRGPK